MVLRLRLAWDGSQGPPGSVSNPCIVFRKDRHTRHLTSSTSIPRTQSAMRTTGMPGRLVRLAAIMVSMFTPLLLAQTQTPPAGGTAAPAPPAQAPQAPTPPGQAGRGGG